MKGTLELIPTSIAWDPLPTDGQAARPFVIGVWEAPGNGVVLRLSARTLDELEAAIRQAREEHRKRLAGRKVRG
jgi:hypothetical protein